MRQAVRVTLPLPLRARAGARRPAEVWSVARAQPGGAEPWSSRASPPVWVRGEVTGFKSLRERALVLHPAGRRPPRCAASCGAPGAQRAPERAGGRRRGVRPRHARRSGRRRVSSASTCRGCCSQRPSWASSSSSSSGVKRGAARATACFDAARKRRAAARIPPPSPWSRAPRARRCTTSSPSPGSAGRRCGSLVVRRPGAGRRRGGRSWCARCAAGQPARRPTCCIVGRGAAAREDLTAFNDERGLPRAGGGARAHDLRRGPRDRRHASPTSSPTCAPRRRPPRRELAAARPARGARRRRDRSALRLAGRAQPAHAAR